VRSWSCSRYKLQGIRGTSGNLACASDGRLFCGRAPQQQLQKIEDKLSDLELLGRKAEESKRKRQQLAKEVRSRAQEYSDFCLGTPGRRLCRGGAVALWGAVAVSTTVSVQTRRRARVFG
jgi:hypothetical protein